MAASKEGMSATYIVTGGASLVNKRPIFTGDSKYLLVCVEKIIRLYSVATGKCVQNLIGHTDLVTCVSCNPHNQLQVTQITPRNKTTYCILNNDPPAGYTATSCSLDGTIRQWDILDGAVLKTFTFPWPIHNMLVHETFSTNQFFLCKEGVRTEVPERYFTLVQTAEVSDWDVEEIFSELSGECEKSVAVSGNGEFLAGINGAFLLFYFLKGRKCRKSFKAGTHPLTCLAVHPNKSMVAVGNEAGQIMIVSNMYTEHKDIISNFEHWHANRVEDLCFSPEGVFLFSVGHECVLVDWNLEKGLKDFLPRLGAPINHVSCAKNSSLKAVCLLDNAILILSQNKIQHTIQGISRSKLYYPTAHIPCGLLVDPRTNALVKNGRIGHLQFYNIEDDESLVTMDITGENYVSGQTFDNIKRYTDVIQASFSCSGDWLATVEEQASCDVSDVQSRLKFWVFDKQKQSFLLNTTVERPHDDSVTALSFQPRKKNQEKGVPVAVTAGMDRKFKLWRFGNNLSTYKKSRCWSCDCVGFYKDALPSGASFSADGSLLAVGFNVTITLWEPDSNVLKKTLCHTLSNQPIRKLEFCRGQSSHLLICTTYDRITTWNLLSCQVQWSVQLSCKLLISDPYSELMASTDSSDNLFVFHPGHSKPVFCMKLHPRSVIFAIFLPHSKRTLGPPKGTSPFPWQKHSQLYLMTEDEDLVSIVTNEEAETFNKKQRFQNDLEEHLPATPFAEFIRSQRTNVKTTSTDLLKKYVSDDTLIKEMVMTPPHILPPVRALSTSFLHSLLLPSDGQRVSEGDHSDSDEDDKDENSEESEDSDAMESTGTMKEEASTVLTTDSRREELIPEKRLAELSDRSRKHLSSYLQNVFSKLSIDSS